MKPMKPMKPLEPIRRESEEAKKWWPHDLGSPSVSGSSNDLRYAYFADKHRIAVDDGKHVKVYDTGGEHISGFSSSESRVLTLHTAAGLRKLSALTEVS